MHLDAPDRIGVDQTFLRFLGVVRPKVLQSCSGTGRSVANSRPDGFCGWALGPRRCDCRNPKFWVTL